MRAVLRSWPCFGHCRVGEEGGEGVQENCGSGKLGRAVLVGDGEVVGLARRRGEGQADERGAHRLRRREEQIERELPDLTQPGDERFELLRRPDDPLNPGRFPADLQLLEERREFKLLEERDQALPVGLPPVARLDIERKFRVRPDPRQLQAQARLVGVLQDRLAGP